jgi:hypothetical protein
MESVRMTERLTDEQLNQLLDGLTRAAKEVRKKQYGKTVAVKPETIDLLVKIARINAGELPSTWLHQYANELEAARAQIKQQQAELEAARAVIVRAEDAIEMDAVRHLCPDLVDVLSGYKLRQQINAARAGEDGD